LVVVLAPREDRHLVEVFGKPGRRSIERSVMQTRSTLDHDLDASAYLGAQGDMLIY
jgi:hypothetical protein